MSRSYEPPFALRVGRFREEKSRIGRVASSMISEGETVILDVGSTVLAAAEVLKERRNITILTPSLRAAWLLADKPDLRVIVTGGIVRPGERSLVGALSERAFESLYCDTLFMGIGGSTCAPASPSPIWKMHGSSRRLCSSLNVG
jgi:DeoR/GlpR family transcriptional regulator of sugar metabolism